MQVNFDAEGKAFKLSRLVGWLAGLAVVHLATRYVYGDLPSCLSLDICNVPLDLVALFHHESFPFGLPPMSVTYTRK